MSLPYETIELAELAKVEYEGFNNDGVASVAVNEEAVDALLASVKAAHDDAWFHTEDVQDGDYVMFRQSLSFSLPQNIALSNGMQIPVLGSCNEAIAKKLKIKVAENNGTVTVDGLQNVTKISVDEVFADLNVTFSGISPALTISIENNSSQPLVKKMIFGIENPKEFYSQGDVVTIKADYTEDMCRETGFIVDKSTGECTREYTATGDASYLTSASQLPSDLIQKAITEGKKAFTDANEYGVRIFCEANLVPVYINKKATFQYGTPNYVSSYFKTVLPEKAGALGNSYNDLDIIYDLTISQADGKSCTAYAAVRFSNIIQNADGSLSYDFSEPSLLSESYFSARVKKVVVDSNYDSHNVERVSP
ncbi:MAG: hypothetical protein K6F28_03030 [Lachnospiraceae bacterium]|nr:hypothetical protein [Lachnospiraceae bacterium]